MTCIPFSSCLSVCFHLQREETSSLQAELLRLRKRSSKESLQLVRETIDDRFLLSTIHT